MPAKCGTKEGTGHTLRQVLGTPSGRYWAHPRAGTGHTLGQVLGAPSGRYWAHPQAGTGHSCRCMMLAAGCLHWVWWGYNFPHLLALFSPLSLGLLPIANCQVLVLSLSLAVCWPCVGPVDTAMSYMWMVHVWYHFIHVDGTMSYLWTVPCHTCGWYHVIHVDAVMSYFMSYVICP